MEAKDFIERFFSRLKGKQERKKWVNNKREVKIYSDWDRNSKQNKLSTSVFLKDYNNENRVKTMFGNTHRGEEITSSMEKK